MAEKVITQVNSLFVDSHKQKCHPLMKLSLTYTQGQTIARLQNTYALNPITALAFYQVGPEHVLLLAGEDTWLRVYDVQTSALLGQLQVFDSQPIHGIHVSSSQTPEEGGSDSSSHIARENNLNAAGLGVLIWGGHSVAHLPQTALQSLIRGATPGPPRPIERQAPDWIHDGILLSPSAPSLSQTLLSPERKKQQQQQQQYDAGALVTAHNEVIPFSLTTTPTSNTSSIRFGPLTSPSRPILYSADLALLAPGVLLVAGGTVFGEIVVWKYYFFLSNNNQKEEEEEDARKWEVLHVFTGHEGSIFGVSISPEMEVPSPLALGGGTGGGGKRMRLLASCSDDRTVRVWDITERKTSVVVNSDGDGVGGGGERSGMVDGRLLVEARETGFGGDSTGTSNPNSEAARGDGVDDQSRCVAVAMGHVSRIWHVKFGRGRRDHKSTGSGRIVEVYSFGEDCSRQRWELDADWERWPEKRTGTLRHGGASTCHSGKNIWSAAVLDRGDGGGDSPLVATGGADGRIVISGKIRGTGSAPDTYEYLDLSLTFDDILRSLHSSTQSPSAETQGKKSAKHTFQRYAFLSDKTIAATASGRLFLATMGDPLVWEEARLDETVVSDLKPYNVVKSPARDTAVLGSASGKVYLFRRGHNVREIANFSQKISDIILLDSSPDRMLDEQQHAWSVIITVLGLDHALLVHFDPSTDTSTIDPRKVRLPEHYIVTAGAFLGDGTLVLGSRTGSVTVYTTGADTGDFIPLTSRKDCKTKDAVTSIVPIPGGSEPTEFLTTCRDGKYRIYALSSASSSSSSTDDKSPTLKLQHEATPPLNTLESAFFTAPTTFKDTDSTKNTKRELIILGFHGQNFLSYNASSRTVLFSVACGGAHRPFASVSAPHDPGQTRFVFSKAGELRVVSQGGVGERVLRGGGHGREIRSVASSFYNSNSPSSSSLNGDGSGVGVLVATAAEDTAIRIWRHSVPAPGKPDDNDEMDCLAVVEGHSAGIQTLRWFSPNYLLSSAGSEELFVWRISHTRARGEYNTLTVVREAAWENDDGSSDRDLRLVDFDVAAWPPPPPPSVPGDDDRGEGVTILISMALSDSSVRSYIYSPSSSSIPPGGSTSSSSGGKSKPFQRLATARYTGACPTQVRHLHVDGDKGEVHLLTAFTDGHVAVWRTTTTTSSSSPSSCRGAEFNLCLVSRLHQSSIKSLDLVPCSSPPPPPPTSIPSRRQCQWLIVTGGDDNALGIMDLVWDANDNNNNTGGGGVYAVRGKYRVRDAHAAAITGLCAVNNHKEEEEHVVVATVSNDQRVKLWRVEREKKDDSGGRRGGGMRIALLENRYSSVADAGDLEVIAPGRLMVGGVGMEVWRVPHRQGG
jgi:hypothetical protein